MSERIQPENNRTFKTGPGNWTGGLNWHSGILDFHQGYIICAAPGSPGSNSISLLYPAIKPVPGNPHGFGVSMYPTNHALGWPAFDWIITDGVYTSFKDTFCTTNIESWAGFVGVYLLPDDWNIENTILTLKIYSPSGFPAELAFDDFSLTEPSIRPQYLPIMGIG